ncbi:MAG: hypothetical protein RL885_10855 [Planctomycetota bacterium]
MSRSVVFRWMLLVASAACAPYVLSLNLAFQSDDYIVVGHFLGGEASLADRALAELTGPQYGLKSPRFYRPVSSLSLALDAALFGPRPFGFHLTNLLLHGVNAALVFVLGWTLWRRRATALVGALAFAWFSTHPDAVIWSVGRVDGWATCFVLLAVLGHLGARRRGGLGYWLLSAISLSLAIGSKESGVTALGLIAGLEVLGLARGQWEPLIRRALAVVPALLVVAGAVTWRRFAIGTWSGGYGGLPGFEHWPGLAGHAFLDLVWMLAPITDAETESLPGGPLTAWMAAILSWLILLRLSVSAGRAQILAPRAVTFGLLWFAITASVLMSLLAREPVGTNLRHWYLPSIGVAWVVAVILTPGPMGGERSLRALLGVALLGIQLTLLGGRIQSFREAAGEALAIRHSLEEHLSRPEGARRLFASRVPNHHQGAFVFAWGLPQAFQPPFESPPETVFPIKGGPEVDPLVSFWPFRDELIMRWDHGRQRADRIRGSFEGGPSVTLELEGRESTVSPDRAVDSSGALEIRLAAGESWRGAVLWLELVFTSGADIWRQQQRFPLTGRIETVRSPVAVLGRGEELSDIRLREVVVRLEGGPPSNRLVSLSVGRAIPEIELRPPVGCDPAHLRRADLEKPLWFQGEAGGRGFRVTLFTAMGTAACVVPAGPLSLLRIATAPPLGRHTMLGLLPPAFGLGERTVYMQIQWLEDPGNPYSVIATTGLLELTLDPELEPVIDGLIEQLQRQSR